MITSAQLNTILDELHGSLADIEASAIITVDGLTLASKLLVGTDENIAGAMGAALHSIASRTASEHKRGAFEQALVKGAQGYVLIITASEEIALVVVARHTAKLALVFLETQRAAEAIAKAVI